ncbi:MAG TPA: CobQ/CobB/MinD/ParA nucleotide binding domain-containing protein, partial [Chloroflexi bacterium]|nr:CobQ/CobB/MinD/ParA nucleotide binding domain-containing protein [Chloroflexota bacterium]
MADKIRVMIVDDIAETREQLRKLMTFDADIEVVAMAGSGEEAVEIAPQVRPDVVLMDINLPGIDGIVATAKIVELVPAAQVIMLSVQGESDYMRRAMMAGARDYLTKPPGADELLDTVHRVYKLAPKRPVPVTPQAKAAAAAAAAAEERLQQARIITVFSPKGGSGTTTVAVNLSIALQNLLGPDAKIVLADANLQFGDASIFMKLQPTRTLADLAPRADEMDQELLNTILTPHTSGVKLLAAPAAPEDAEIFQESGVEEETGANRRLKQILQFTRQRCDLMIVDTAHAIDSSMLALLDISDLLLVVTRPVIPEIRGARLFIALLQKINYPLENVGLVINSVDNKRMGIQPEAIERAMMPALVHIPLDERIALRAANYGVPFVIQEPRAAISQSFTTLAQAVRDRLTV